MIEIKRDDGVWTTFYVIRQLDLAGEGDTLNDLPLQDLPAKIYGKFVGGICGYQPWWVYVTVDKSKLREKKLNKKSA